MTLSHMRHTTSTIMRLCLHEVAAKPLVQGSVPHLQPRKLGGTTVGLVVWHPLLADCVQHVARCLVIRATKSGSVMPQFHEVMFDKNPLIYALSAAVSRAHTS